MARLPDLRKLKKKWGMKLISIASLIEYRHQRERLIKKISESEFPTKHGTFQLHVFSSVLDRRIHYALTLGKISKRSTTLVRVQSANVLTDALGLTTKGRSGSGIDEALQAISQNKSGALIYLEPRRKDAEEIVGSELNPGKMDFRDYGIGAQVLAALGLKNSGSSPATVAGWLAWKVTDWKLWSVLFFLKSFFMSKDSPTAPVIDPVTF